MKRTHLPSGEVATSDPKMLPKLLQVPERKYPCENKVLLFSLAFHYFSHMIGTQKACQLEKVFTTLELSNLLRVIKEKKNIEKSSFLMIFFLVLEETTLGIFCLSGLPISEYTKYSHFEQTKLCTICIYLAKLTENYFRFVKDA